MNPVIENFRKKLKLKPKSKQGDHDDNVPENTIGGYEYEYVLGDQWDNIKEIFKIHPNNEGPQGRED